MTTGYGLVVWWEGSETRSRLLEIRVDATQHTWETLLPVPVHAVALPLRLRPLNASAHCVHTCYRVLVGRVIENDKKDLRGN